MKSTLSRVVLLSVAGLLIAGSSSPVAADHPWEKGVWDAKPMDWPYWRGPEMNGISREKNITTNWTPNRGSRKGKNVLWFNKELAGRSTPIVMDGKLYTITRDQPGTAREREKVVCVDAETGVKIWENPFNVFLSDVPDSRVGWSSVVGDPNTGDLFAQGVCGLFLCIDGNTGATKWSHSLAEEYGALNTYGGRTNFPIIHGDLVIISAIVIGWGEMAKPAHRFIAFDKRNGQPVWFESTRILPFDTTYSAPTIRVINGESQFIFCSGDGTVHGFQPQTGRKLWKYQISPTRGVNVAPLVVDNMVFAGHSEENVGDTTMGALFALDISKPGKPAPGYKYGEYTKQQGEMWRHNQWVVGRSSPLYLNGFVYAVTNGGVLKVADAKTGKELESHRLGGQSFGSPLYVDGKLIVCTDNGVWSVFEPQKDGKLLRAEVTFPNGKKGRPRRPTRLSGVGRVLASPIVSHGRLYVTTTSGTYCIGKKGVKPTAADRPKFATEKPVKSDLKPAHVQVVPVESLLKPGQHQPFQVRLYNSRGQYLKTVNSSEVKFSIDGRGAIDESGVYKSDEKDGHYAVHVTAEVAGMKGDARIRVVPELPWNIDFNDGNIPVTWIGLRYRHVPLDYDLYKKLKDDKNNLLAARLYIFLQTNFVNGMPGGGMKKGQLTFNNKPPRMPFTDLLRYLGLDAKVSSLEEAKAALDPLLKLIEAEGYLKSHQWSTSDETGTQLVVIEGDRKIKGNGVMVKISTIPKGQQSQGWMGHTDFANYTIQADVLGEQRKAGKVVRMPDIGLEAQRYAMLLKGSSKELEIRSWQAHDHADRPAKVVKFDWKPYTWYTMKLQASYDESKNVAVLKGKCWKKGEPEPKEWQLTVEDPQPNQQGSPGLFGVSLHAELFYDNLKVYRNK